MIFIRFSMRCVFIIAIIFLVLVADGSEKNSIKPIRTIIVDEDTWPHFNWASFDQEKVVSYADYQYSIYWDADTVLVLVRRDLRDDNVQTVHFPQYKLTINPRDGHRNTVVGISPCDGRLHFAWDHHNNDLRYTRTRKGFLTNPSPVMTMKDFEPKQVLAPDAPQRVTYPRFINDREGHLYFIYRTGSSGNGRTVIARYSDDTGTWRVFNGQLFASEGTYKPWNNCTSRNAYLNDVLFDNHNRLHVTWVYREAGKSWASNHDLHYAYSDDFGITWLNNAGDPIADLSNGDPIDIHDSGIIVQEIPVYSWLMNQCAMALDSNNQPHVALYRLPTTYKPEHLEHDPPSDIKKQLRFYHYWRDVDKRWHSSGPLDLTKDLIIDRPNIILDKKDMIVIYWPSGKGFRCYVACADDNWQNWTSYVLTGPDFTSNDACKHDRHLLVEKGILSFTADPNGEKSTKGYAFLDFDLKEIGHAGE